MCVVMLLVCSVVLLCNENNTKTAYAEETSKYLLCGSVYYVADLPYNAGYTGTTAYTSTCDLADNFAVYLYGTSIHGTTAVSASDGKVFGFSYVTITANVMTSTSPHNSNYPFAHQSYTLVNSTTGVTVASGSLSGTGLVTLTARTLSDGYYTLTYVAGGTRSGIGAGTITDTFTYNFSIDSTAPTCTLKAGGSTISSGSYTNSYITYSASDVNFSMLAYKSPSATSWSYTTSSSYTVSATTANNGLWQFYAYDTNYNISSTVTAYLDTTSPSGSLSTSSTYTNSSFYYTASDTSGYCYCQYQTPNSSSWTTYTSGSTISSSSTNGTYFFRCYDKAGNYSSESSVYLDTVSPTGTLYVGTSTVTSGSKVSGSYVKFTASDSGSGLSKIYVKAPSSSGYYVGSSSTQYTTEGTYYFYAVDNAGNTSSVYSITLDNSPPELSISGASFGDITASNFTVSVDDGTIYYSINNSSWNSSLSSFTVTDTSTDGMYSFFAVDSMGNASAIEYVVVMKQAPTGELIYSTTDNSVTFMWYNEYYTATINGNTYISGTWVTTEGYYTISLSNNAGKIAVYTFTISCNYVLVATIEPTCEEEGYDLYRCTSCGAEEKRNIVEPLGHDFVETIVDATCTESGKIIYTCLNCGYEYEEETELSTGHIFTTTVIEYATCTESGLRYYICDTCGYEYYEEIPPTGHNFVMTEEKLDDGTTQRTYTCTECGYSYTENIGNQYETVTVYVVEIIDTYTQYMWWVLLATSGIWSIVMGVFIIIAQKNEDKEKSKKMLINYGIGLVAIAILVVACPLLVQGIASFVA